MKFNINYLLSFFFALSFILISNTIFAQEKKENPPSKTTKSEQKPKAKKGIIFFKGTWTELLAEAEAQDKPIFVDTYTSWCGPCKKMARETFTDPEVGAFYNANYVNYKIDMEKGEGPTIRNKYKVKAFPTLLYLNKKGKILNKGIGFKKVADFLKLGRKSIISKAEVASMDNEYKKGKNDAAFLRKYMTLLWAKDDRKKCYEVAEKYFGQLDKKAILAPENLDMVFSLSENIEGTAFKLLTENRATFIDKYDTLKVERKIAKAGFETVKEAAKNKDKSLFNKGINAIKLSSDDIDTVEDYVWRANLSYSQTTKDWTKYAKTATDYLDEYEIEDANLLNSIAWTFFEHIDDTNLLEKAELWVAESISIKSSFHNNDTYANILHKLGKRDQAIVAAEKAILIGKQSKKDYKATEKLLNTIIFGAE